MKSYTDLYQKICTFSAIYRAYQLCRRGKREREYAIEFEKDLETNIFNLRDDLVSGRWTPGQYSRFFVEDPKRRLINAPPYKDRVVHQAVSSVILPIWEPMFIRDTYACLTGRGTHLAVDRLQQFMRRYPKGMGYVLQLDIKSYFASIDHEILLALLSKRIRDWKMMHLIRLIIESYEDTPGVGIPLGNLTSQGFANIYLHELDMFAKHEIKIKQYLRYMDDITLVHSDKTQLWEWRDEIEAYLADRQGDGASFYGQRGDDVFFVGRGVESDLDHFRLSLGWNQWRLVVARRESGCGPLVVRLDDLASSL